MIDIRANRQCKLVFRQFEYPNPTLTLIYRYLYFMIIAQYLYFPQFFFYFFKVNEDTLEEVKSLEFGIEILHYISIFSYYHR